ncbi:MAG: VTT domain-containing protein [Chloroflexi bacterium]|nr:VTT domain-containing protein [Chloroflexota bacterium]
MSIEEFLTAYGLAAIFVVMLVKGIGIPIPIPGDLIMIVAAAQVAIGRLVLWQAFVVILVAMVAGGSVQFLLARALGRKFLYRVGGYVGLTHDRLDRVSATMQKSGPLALGITLVTPGIRSAAVPAAGLAGLPYLTFFIGALIGSALFLALHFAIGLIGGPLIAFVMSAINLPLIIFIAAFFAIGLIGWMLMRRRARGATLERLGDFADAACPVCLAIGATEHLRHAAIRPQTNI